MLRNLVVLILLAAPASAQLAAYDAGPAGNPAVSPDPTSIGWTLVDPSAGGVVMGAVSPDAATGSNAWAVTDGVTTNGGRAHYEQLLTPAQMLQAHNEGWELSVRMRLIAGATNTIFVEYATGQTAADDRWLLFFTVSGTDVVVDATLAGVMYSCVGAMDGEYHTFSLHKPPLSTNLTANFYCDGNLLGPVVRAASNGNAPNGGINWGSGSSAGTGRVHFNRVSFTATTAGVPFCYGDGSGASCPCGNSASALSRQGCLHSGGVGMVLNTSGSASWALDNLVLTAEQCPLGNTGIMLCGNQSTVPITLFDGMECAFGQVIRLSGQFQTNGSASDTGIFAQDPTGNYFVIGKTFTFQYASRDVAAGPSPCGSSANLSHAVKILLEP